MEKLKQHPELNINQVAAKYGIETEKLVDEQLNMLRIHLKRDSILWEQPKFGKG